MTFDQAKEILNDILVDGTEPGYPIMDNAIKLGIEAMTRLEVYRARHPELIWELLEGETQK